MQLLGVDLHEVREWPLEKKLDYQGYMIADQQRQQAQQDGEMGDMDMPDMGGMNPGKMGNVNPQQAMQQAKQMGGGMPQQGGGMPSGGSATSKDVHPHLQRYGNVVHVGDGDGD